ncbi:hypothetical protein I0P70_03620 [Pontibacter sp. FD36]|uniref:hypothetical protein n=1 Tax=Pontibacter sp. FD36 TaxID=2789860 RepID=UPI0018A9938B|nr:hypothetical protein [Pontibacter sp. FD36]MBF8962326.1 hypothetical protein [Pontibacter sp. FD36]
MKNILFEQVENDIKNGHILLSDEGDYSYDTLVNLAYANRLISTAVAILEEVEMEEGVDLSSYHEPLDEVYEELKPLYRSDLDEEYYNEDEDDKIEMETVNLCQKMITKELEDAVDLICSRVSGFKTKLIFQYDGYFMARFVNSDETAAIVAILDDISFVEGVQWRGNILVCRIVL